MPILKPISGHGSTGGIRRYLEKGGRALARDLFNLSYDERDAGALGEDAKEACAWDAEMDATRAAFGTDAPWRGKPARTFKHFVLSPDPGDDIDLATLRELACSWALRHFDDHEIAIVYHDDNARGIPHAHIVVNNANLRTGYRMQTQHPEDLNRDLQDMARERGLSATNTGSDKKIHFSGAVFRPVGLELAHICKLGCASNLAETLTKIFKENDLEVNITPIQTGDIQML